MKAPYARTLFELLCEQAYRNPRGAAVIEAQAQTSFADLEVNARKIAAALRAQGICRGDRIGLIVNNRVEWLEIVFGAAALGAVAVPFSTWSTSQELKFLLQDSEVRFLFTLARFGKQEFASEIEKLVAEDAAAEHYPRLQHIVVLDGDESSKRPSYSTFREVPPLAETLPPGEAASAGDDALIIYTSGSTSYPKAVRLVQHAIIENGFNIGERQGLGPEDRVLLAPPLFWTYGSVNALPAAFTHGAALVLQDRFDAGGALDLIEKHCCTSIYTLPGMTSDLLTHPDFSPERTKSLRTGLTIGSPQDVRRAATELGAKEICNIYGASEAYGNCCVTEHFWPLERRANCQGRPLPGVEIRISDPDSEETLGPKEPGLVDVRGFLSPGYCGTSSASNETAFTSDGFFRSGDYGYLTEAGEFVFVGRSAEMIKSGGINVSPVEIEEVLLQHPDIVQAGVVGVDNAERGEAIYAFVVAKGTPPEPDALRAHCRKRLSSYKVPQRVIVSDDLPQTNTGKLLRRELKKQAAELAAAEQA